MENKTPLLSICIPTYNGGYKLDTALMAISKSIKTYDDVEVIISDNASTDDTPEIISKYLKDSRFRSYKNENNLGFNRNMFMLIRYYARGKYCWVVGDDDFIDLDAFDNIRLFLLSGEIEYLSLAHRVVSDTEYQNMEQKSRLVLLSKGSYFDCLEANVTVSNILGTFMSSSVFLKEKVVNSDFSIFSNESWTNYYSLFPNAFLMINAFKNSPCGYVKEPMLSVLIHEKAWDDKSDEMYFCHLPNLYFYIEKTLGKTLLNSRTCIRKEICRRLCINIYQLKWRNLPLSLLLRALFWKEIYVFIFSRIVKKIR